MRTRSLLLLLPMAFAACTNNGASTADMAAPDMPGSSDGGNKPDLAPSGSDGSTTGSGTITAYVIDSAQKPVDGATLTLDGASGTTTDGAYTFSSVASGKLLVLSAQAAGGVATCTRVSVDAGKATTVTLQLPAVDTTSFAADGTARSLTVGSLGVSLPANTAWTSNGQPYTGTVTLRAAFDPGPLSAPPPYNVDANGMQTPSAPVVATFNLTAVGMNEAVLEPSAPITVTFTASVYNATLPLGVQYFDTTTGQWTDAAIGTRDAASGQITAQLPHLTYWQVINGTPISFGGFFVGATKGGKSVSGMSFSWSCPDAIGVDGKPAQGSLANSAGACIQVQSPSRCTLTASDGKGLTLSQGLSVANGCVCNWSSQQCQDVEFALDATPKCGDGIVQAGEQCDDGAGNGMPGDACSASCKSTSCTFSLSGPVNNVLVSIPPRTATCTFLLDPQTGNPQRLAVADASLQPFLMNMGVGMGVDSYSAWNGYATAGGTLLGIFTFQTPLPALASNTTVQSADATIVGAKSLSDVILYDPSNGTGSFGTVDTTGKTFDLTIQAPAKQDSGGYPGANDNGALTLTPTTDPSSQKTTFHVSGSYTTM